MQPEGRKALVTATFRRRVELQFADATVATGRVSGRKLRPVCGDRVRASPLRNEPEWLISEILPRDNELSRPDSRGHSEVLAANVTFLSVVAADVPNPDWFIVDRYLSAAELMNVDAAIIFNKIDMLRPDTRSLEELGEYEKIGYRTVRCSARTGENMNELEELFAGNTGIIVGQSGVGKSSLINFMVKNASQRTAAVSNSTGEGRHTTVNSVMLTLSGGGRVIDSPGVRDYAPVTQTVADVIHGFREIESTGFDCRFTNCRHLREPGCAVKAAVDTGEVSARRYESYKRLNNLTERLAAERGPKS